ncbi:MAG: sodium:proton antiporter [Rhodospirillales bacterium]|nr:sodium:proton antiporter [Rhodospirillales bacterium]
MDRSGLLNPPARVWGIVALAGTLAGCLVVWLIAVTGLWGDAVVWIQARQRAFFDALTAAIHAIREQGRAAAWTLIAVSFLYGVFHAVGPGHGKAVLATYLMTQRSDLARGLGLSSMSAMFQGLTAIVAVQVAVLILEIPLRQARGLATDLETVSYGLVMLIGVVLCISALRRMRGKGHRHHHGSVEAGWGWRKLVAVAFTIGLRPCSGAILVLLLACAIDLRWAGIGAAIAMSAGTALSLGILALVTLVFRDHAAQLAERLGHSHSHSHGPNWTDWIALAGGVVILLLGLSLLRTALATPQHPLF